MDVLYGLMASASYIENYKIPGPVLIGPFGIKFQVTQFDIALPSV